MNHSSSYRAPITFRGFGLCVAAIVAGYIGLIGALGVGIKHSLDQTAHPTVASSSAAPIDASSGGAAPVIKANASD